MNQQVSKHGEDRQIQLYLNNDYVVKIKQRSTAGHRSLDTQDG